MADDIFGAKQEETPAEAPQEPEKIKLGEKEYTQEELSKLVGLGEFAQDVQTKQNRDLTKIYPDYVKATQRLSEVEKELEETKQAKITAKAETGAELTQEELREQARKEARNLGILLIDDVNNYIDQRLEARDLREDVESVVEVAKTEGKPEVTPMRLVEHMQETGIRNPQKAYNDLFEKELDDWKAKQIDKIKKPGMVTESESTAGSKQPQKVAITPDNLEKQVEERMFQD